MRQAIIKIMWKMTKGIFNNLEEIEEPRDAQAREETTLEKLLETGEILVRKYACEFKRFDDITNFDRYEVYDQMYTELKEQLLKDVHFTDDDIKSYVMAKANNDNEWNESQALGAYTGALLQLFTERNRLQGKPTVFYINGNGIRFDYLFFYAREIERLIVENFIGDNICRSIGISSNGFTNQVIGINITGNYVLASIGKLRGSIEQIIGVGIKGNGALSSIGSDKGMVNQVLGIDIDGCAALERVGTPGGRLNQVIGYGIKGDKALNSSGTAYAHINQIIGVYIEGNQVMGNIGINDGYIDMIFGAHIKGKHIFNGIGTGTTAKQLGLVKRQPGLVKELGYHDSHKISTYMRCGHIICGARAESMYEQMVRETHLEEIAALARSMQGKPCQEVLAIADELYAMRPEVPKGFFGRK